MNMTIGSQMTQEEIEAYAARMLALVPAAEYAAQAQIVLQVIGACGRPIAAAEQAMIAEAKAQRVTGQGFVPMVVDGAFGGGGGPQ